jgi:hypothetical protein
MGEKMRESILSQCKAQNLPIMDCNPIKKLTPKPNLGHFTYYPEFTPILWLIICVLFIYIIIPVVIGLSRIFVFKKCIHGHTIMELLLKPCFDRSSKIKHDTDHETAKQMREAHDINKLLETYGLGTRWCTEDVAYSHMDSHALPIPSQYGDSESRIPRPDQPQERSGKRRQKRAVLIQHDINIDALLTDSKRKIRRGSQVIEREFPVETLSERVITTPEGGWVITY